MDYAKNTVKVRNNYFWVLLGTSQFNFDSLGCDSTQYQIDSDLNALMLIQVFCSLGL